MSSSALPKYESLKLENGLEIVAIPMGKTGVVTTDIFYKVGSRNEILGKSGIAHMLEHMNFKSTKNLKAGEFDEIVKRFGGINNASTGFDYTHYYIKSSKNNWGKSLELFSDLMQNLSLKDKEFQPERDVVAEERRWRTENSPLGALYYALFNTAFVYHPYHWTPIGFMDDIKNWSINDIKDFHKTYYRPSNAVILVAGDIKTDAVFTEVKKHFEHIKENKKILPRVHTVEPLQEGERRAIIFKESETEMVAIAFKTPDFKHTDQVALSSLGELLAAGKSSRLQKSLINEKRIVNQIYAYNMDLIDPGVFMILAVCNNGIKAETVEKEIWKAIEDLKLAIDSEELEKLKMTTKADFTYALEESSSVADLFGSYIARGDMTPLLTYEANLEKLTTKDLEQCAKNYLKKSVSTTVILKKKGKND